MRISKTCQHIWQPTESDAVIIGELGKSAVFIAVMVKISEALQRRHKNNNS